MEPKEQLFEENIEITTRLFMKLNELSSVESACANPGILQDVASWCLSTSRISRGGLRKEYDMYLDDKYPELRDAVMEVFRKHER